jgi:very-short-patch-repair endonuclease
MREKGLTVLRIKNNELSDIEDVLKKIDEFMKSLN